MISLGIKDGPGIWAIDDNCPPTVSDAERKARLFRAIDSSEKEEFHEVRCCHCGKLWMANQWHLIGERFSCSDRVRYEDYERD